MPPLLLYQSVVFSVIDYGLGLTTMAQTNLLNLDRVQNEAMRVTVGNTKYTPTETMRFMTGQILDESSRGLNTASMPADKPQSNQGLGKVPGPIPASL